MPNEVQISFVSNLVTQPFSPLVKKAPLGWYWIVDHREFGAVDQILLSDERADILIVHLDYRYYFTVAVDEIAVERARKLVTLSDEYATRTGTHVVLNTVYFEPLDFSLADYALEIARLAQINSLILSAVENYSSVSAVDVARTLAILGAKNALRERNRFLMQFPYSREATNALIDLYARHISLIFTPRKKLLLVDADNTLWRGIVGEEGAGNVGIDTDVVNVVHWKLQEQLTELKKSGILLGLVTKNNPADIEDVFARRRMPLALADFVVVKCNWNAKSANILEIVDELNLGLASVVFVDDNPFELGEVETRLPEVSCYRFPHDDLESAFGLLGSIQGLHTLRLTAEDREKTIQYRHEADRKNHAQAFSSIDDYISSLGIELFVSRNNEQHAARIAQLTNKTNQFNLTTRRYSETEIREWMKSGEVYDFRVVDRYGDMGIVGVVIIVNGEIDTFLMSCRALGRKIERKILSHVCRTQVHGTLRAQYIKTDRNAQVSDFYASHGFRRIASDASGSSYLMQEMPADIESIHMIECENV